MDRSVTMFQNQSTRYTSTRTGREASTGSERLLAIFVIPLRSCRSVRNNFRKGISLGEGGVRTYRKAVRVLERAPGEREALTMRRLCWALEGVLLEKGKSGTLDRIGKNGRSRVIVWNARDSENAAPRSN